MKTHEFAEIFPLMNRKEFGELKNDIQEKGQQELVVLFEGKILDGRNRYNACKELKIEPKFREYKGKDPLGYVMSTNLKRRHLTDSQKAVVGRRYKVYYAKLYPVGRPKKGEPVHTIKSEGKERASEKAGEVAGVSGRYIDMAEEVIEKKPEVEEKIMAGETTVKQEYKKIKLEEQKKEVEKLKSIVGEYDVLVIDPPWSYEEGFDTYDEKGHRGTTDYPVMKLGELRKLKLPMAKNCVVWLWVTNSMFKEAIELTDHWGLERKTILTWDKQNMGVGHYLRNITEHCILCFKGKPYFKNTTWTTLISEKRTTHSTKPEIFYKLVEDTCTGRKLDYFARKKRDGWDVYGNEIK